MVDRSSRTFTFCQFDSCNKTETYEIFRHPLGDRKDLFRWSGADSKSVAKFDIYRPSDELNPAGLSADWLTGTDNPRLRGAF
jgi:hypothetical protein